MNYYEILEINENATNETNKKHYYNLAKKYRPDKNANNLIVKNLNNQAYSTLSIQKRYLYDLKIKLNILVI